MDTRMSNVVMSMLAVAIFMLSTLADVDQDWSQFEKFNIQYSRHHRDLSEKMYRFKVFQESLARHKRLNDYETVHSGTAVYGVNKFSDLTQEEFASMYLSGSTAAPVSPHIAPNSTNRVLGVDSLPDSYDWREKGVIGGIRNQQKCGSCWAFAVVESIESAYAIQNNSKLSLTLSAQQLISCDYDGSRLKGCQGGVLPYAYLTIEQQGMTLVADSVYPFISENGETYACKPNLPNTGLQLVNHQFYYGESQLKEDAMKVELVTFAPLTVSLNAVSWQDYIGGIIQHHCTGADMDHAVQIVGYNMTGEVPYWMVRNTWGTDWGEDGYVRIKYGDDTCGISKQVAVVTRVVRVNG